MASVKLAGTVFGIFLLVLLSHASRLPYPAEESSAVNVASDGLDDANPAVVEASPVEKEEDAEKENVPAVAQVMDHVDLSLRRPFHGSHRHRHCHHSHPRGSRFHGRAVVIPYGNDMLPMPKDGDLAGGLRKDEEIAGTEVALSEEERRWRRKRREHKRKKAEEDEDSDSDSDSDDEDEGAMEMAKKKHRRWRRKMERKEKGGWLKWIRDLWE